MLRSRGERPGRFHRSAMGPVAYFPRPGAPIWISSDIDMVVCSAWADDETTRKSDAMVVNKLLMPNSSGKTHRGNQCIGLRRRRLGGRYSMKRCRTLNVEWARFAFSQHALPSVSKPGSDRR